MVPLTLPFKIAYFKYKRLTAGAVRPWFINFITTYRCNSRCTICGIWNKYTTEPKRSKEELTLTQIREEFFVRNKEFLRELRHIGLTGGEPFLRTDIVEIVRLIRTILPHVKTGIQTNGLSESIKEKIKEIVGFYPEFSLAVSLDGTRQTHDEVRGVRGAFDRAVDLIRFARRLNIPVTSGMTLNPLNYKEIRQVKKIADELDVEFSCFLAERAPYFNNTADSLDLNQEMKKEIVTTLQELFGYHYYMDNLWFLMDNKHARRLPCYSGYTSLVIDPYGEVKPCLLIDDSFGNIKRDSLRDMLTSGRARQLRRRLASCACWCQCEVSASAVTDPLDVGRWLCFRCRDKRGFLREVRQKLGRI